MDRSDNPEFLKNHYRSGRRAFDSGKGRDWNPWAKGSLAWKSWDAGFADRDAENRAQTKEDEMTG